MTIRPWRATCVQMSSQRVTGLSSRADAWQLIRQNVKTARQLIDAVFNKAETRDTRLVVLPEFAFQGPPLQEDVQEWIDKACCPIPGEISGPLQDAAREYGVYLGANQFEFDPEWPGRYFNTAFLIDPRGEVILKYRRILSSVWPSPHDFMDAYFARYGLKGTFPVVDTELGKLAMLVGGEVYVPEAARMFMLGGAEVILLPDNSGARPDMDTATVVRAHENMAYFVSTNVAGPVGFGGADRPVGGTSQIIDFDGNVLAMGDGAEPSTRVSAVIDVERLRQARRETGRRNRLVGLRFEIYLPLYQQAVFWPAGQFADRPMASGEETKRVFQLAQQNMARRGVVVEAERD